MAETRALVDIESAETVDIETVNGSTTASSCLGRGIEPDNVTRDDRCEKNSNYFSYTIFPPLF